jgi:hypothetical protein
MRNSKLARWAVGALLLAAIAFLGALQFGGVYRASDVEWATPPVTHIAR